MRRVMSAGLLLAPIALWGLPAHAGEQDFTLVNSTGYQIDDVYVSENDSSKWGSDIMGSGNVLTDGSSVKITFTAPPNSCSWDLKVKYNDGTEPVWQALNLCNIDKVTLFWDSANQKTRAVTE